MILGILSDTHGDHQICATAVALLEGLDAEALVHCGDIGGDRVLDALGGHRVRFVWGNTDFVHADIESHVRSVGLAVPTTPPLRFELDGRALAVFHGHETQFSRLVRVLEIDETPPAGGELHYVFYGHTHLTADDRIGAVRFINPGALHRARVHTVATLDLTTDQLKFWCVDQPARDTPRAYVLPND